jgi:TRAP-type mannitol/chloroaromatic compound transport system permease large subunit
MANDVLTAVPLFLFMGYIVERANIVERLFATLNIAAGAFPGSMAWPRSSPARCSPPPPASSARWSR